MARHPLRAFDRHWVRPIELLEQVSFSTVAQVVMQQAAEQINKTSRSYSPYIALIER
jgi:hypothetical protein